MRLNVLSRCEERDGFALGAHAQPAEHGHGDHENVDCEFDDMSNTELPLGRAGQDGRNPPGEPREQTQPQRWSGAAEESALDLAA